ncbi:uncharacterized protein [Parasteatoda tepidariorum]|uniref:uncharacterized protein n=1 Tax=Parasteatoda tepidariorum TaxID=114398 RepID=UPI00077F902A|nr:uncharacterized protein LOC107439259 [Parasteatoda tepidariorum]XP_015907269.1 uncharacterized protein LOC107439259 [Parasteatoda tepidariorum]XP_015907270.1 uncharacterized protein LOC107439259 [Parasteatoda tepidariorum]XP_042899448.1 uncharacterized protein LOC107439259 [Parasteatoda tepidariorum]
MSGKVKKRSATNSADSATLTLNERILKECHDFYVDQKNGLVKIAAGLDVDLLPPRKKVTVLLLGNHSAGKSSFINWYIEEHILKTGVAIETQGFAFVTSGKKRETLTGNATLHLYPHFKPLEKIKGLLDFISTEISTSKQKKFSLVTFIDTPGLVDGEMNYPFDVNKAIQFLGNIADLIFVFFDPIGQALRKRTLNVVEALSAKHSDKIKLYLSKADEAGNETDRQKVLMQIVQELCKRPTLNRAGLDLSTIYIPNPNRPVRCANQIEDVCKEIEKTINRTVQNTLNTLEYDCHKIEQAIEDKIRYNQQNQSRNFVSGAKGLMFGVSGIVMLFCYFLGVLLSGSSIDTLRGIIGPSLAEVLTMYLKAFEYIWSSVSDDDHLTITICVIIIVAIFFGLAHWYIRLTPTFSKKQKMALLEKKEYLQNVVINRKRQLYDDYLRQSVAEHEL